MRSKPGARRGSSGPRGQGTPGVSQLASPLVAFRPAPLPLEVFRARCPGQAPKDVIVFLTEQRRGEGAHYGHMGKGFSNAFEIISGKRSYGDVCFASRSSPLESFPPAGLARVDVFGEAVKRVNSFNNIFTCDLQWEVGPSVDAQGTRRSTSVPVSKMCGLPGSHGLECSSALPTPHL